MIHQAKSNRPLLDEETFSERLDIQSKHHLAADRALRPSRHPEAQDSASSGGCDKCKTLTPQVTALRIPNPVRWIAVWRSSFWGVVIRTDIFGDLLFALMKPVHYRRSLWYQHGLICKALPKVSVILLHDAKNRFLGELSMVLGK